MRKVLALEPSLFMSVEVSAFPFGFCCWSLALPTNGSVRLFNLLKSPTGGCAPAQWKNKSSRSNLPGQSSEDREMLCLNCGTEMMNNEVITKHGRISYDACEQCGSLWLDAGELDKMAFQVEGSIEYCSQTKDETPESRSKRCPRCGNTDLDKVRFLEFSDIVLHRCGNCGGFWLDGGELNLIDQELKKIMPVHGRGFSDFVNNVHVPYWYKRLRRKSSEADFDGIALPVKGAHEEKSTSDICPACGHTLSLYKAWSTEFEGCPRCKGIWLAKDELRKLKNSVEHSSLRWLNDEIENLGKTSARISPRRCVRREDGQLVSVLFGNSSVMIDWCPRCQGMWLERGEFESMIEYLKDEKAGMKREGIEKELLDELRRVRGGGPESSFNELRDAGAAIAALINATIFEHPMLLGFLQSFSFLKGI